MIKLNSKNIFSERSPIHIAYTIFQDEEQSYEHNHDFCEFFLIESGNLHHNINGKKILLQERHLCLINSTDIHSFQKVKKSDDVFMLNVAFKEDLLIESLQFLYHDSDNLFAARENHILLDDVTFELLKMKIKLLMDEGIESISYKQTFLFKSLLIDVIYQFAESRIKSNSEIPIWLVNSVKKMQRNENFVEGLERFVQLSKKSQEHLTRVMKKYYKVTPTSFINSLRLFEAAKLLLNSDLLVSEIMYEVGFNNVSHFMKLFKEKFGTSPKNYRRINKIIR